MRILLDECVDPRLKVAFPDDIVKTAFEMGWSGLQNGELLALAEGQFDIFVTNDKGIEHQQNLSKLSLGILVVSVRKNTIEYYRPIFAELRQAASKVRPGQVLTVISS